MPIFFEFYRKLQSIRARTARSELLPILGGLILLALTGMIAYSLIEGWSLLDALYATVITITTVGYGDVTPKTPQGRVFAIFFTLFAITIAGYSISMLAAYAIERRNRRITNQFRKRLMQRIDSLQKHYIVCGADLVGTRIAEEFYLRHVPYVVIDQDEERVKSALLYSHPEYFEKKVRTFFDAHEVDLSAFEDLSLQEVSEKLDIPYVLADPTDDVALIKAGIGRAAGLIAACPDDRDNLSIVIGARSLAKREGNDTLRIMTRASEPRNMSKLYLAGADFVRIPSITSGMEMATHILNPEIGNWWYSHLGNENSARPIFQQITLRENPAWVGQTVSDVHKNGKTVILSVKRDGKFLSPPAYDLVLQADDIAIALG